MKKSRIIYFILAILFGIFAFVGGEFDDSPGAQLIGVIAGVTGVIGLVKRKKD